MKKIYILLAVLFMHFAANSQSTLYVDINLVHQEDLVYDGLSWESAFNYLQEALDNANSNFAVKEIRVAQGTYYPTAGSDRNASFKILRNDLKIFGGFEISLNHGSWYLYSEPQNVISTPTILSGDIGVRGNADDNSYHVVTIAGSNSGPIDASLRLDGFTITGGRANGTGSIVVKGETIPQSSGGGIYVSGSSAGNICSPSIANCTFSANSAGLDGGAVYINGTASGSSNPPFVYCNFSSNKANKGGAVFSNGNGGNTLAAFTDCVFSLNQSYYGAAVYNEGTNGISNPVFLHCMFVSNLATNYAGAICNNSNSSGQSSPSVINCDFVSNSGGTGGGAVGNFGSGSLPVITNSIFYSNAAGNSTHDIYNADGAGAVVHNSITQVYGINGQNGNLAGADPMFINLSDADGADNIYGTSDDGLHLQLGSPGINAGNNSALPAGVTTDFTGNRTRIQQFIVDIGAFENVNCSSAGSVLYVDSSVAISGNGSSWGTAVKELRDALPLARACPQIQQVWVAKGTYPVVLADSRPIGSGVLDSSFRILRNGLKLYGGFAGKEASLLLRDINTNPTILTGSRGGLVQHIITIIATPSSNIDTTTRLDGFTITGSASYGNGGSFIVNGQAIQEPYGGGILNHGRGAGNSCKPFIANCTFTGLFKIFGAGIFNDGSHSGESSPFIFKCKFLKNEAGEGIITNLSQTTGVSNPVIDSCLFENNYGRTYGGAISNEILDGVCSPLISNCIFTNNKAGYRGGAIFSLVDGGAFSPVIKNCEFNGNKIYERFGSGLFGGAIENKLLTPGGSLNAVISGCNFSSNSSNENGGAISNDFMEAPQAASSLTNALFSKILPMGRQQRLSVGGAALFTIMV